MQAVDTFDTAGCRGEFFSETQKALWRCQREGCRYNPRSCFFLALNSSSVIIPLSRRVASCSSSSRGEMSLEDRDGDASWYASIISVGNPHTYIHTKCVVFPACTSTVNLFFIPSAAFIKTSRIPGGELNSASSPFRSRPTSLPSIETRKD